MKDKQNRYRKIAIVVFSEQIRPKTTDVYSLCLDFRHWPDKLDVEQDARIGGVRESHSFRESENPIATGLSN